MNDKMLSGFTEPLIDKYPNTYTFTKSLAEHLIQKESEHLPFMIVRPSIVSSSISDPFPVSMHFQNFHFWFHFSKFKITPKFKHYAALINEYP